MSLIGAVDHTLYLVTYSRWCRGVAIGLSYYDLGVMNCRCLSSLLSLATTPPP